MEQIERAERVTPGTSGGIDRPNLHPVQQWCQRGALVGYCSTVERDVEDSDRFCRSHRHQA
ncbi:MAG: hypothetical protein KDD81_12490, partial [Rhodobacteraceae bacterium]|nr:hypothetical protein [Paracoccaceae bacterium]